MWQGFHAASAAPEALNHDCKVTGNQNHRVARATALRHSFIATPKTPLSLWVYPARERPPRLAVDVSRNLDLTPFPPLLNAAPFY
jgi:hypothetical protein